MIFWYGADYLSSAIIDRGLRHAADPVPVGQFGEFHGFNHFSLDHRAFHSHLVSEHHGSRAVRSGRGYEDLQQHRLGELCQRLACFYPQARVAARNQHHIVHQ
jgi:hypothetical protein